MMSSPDPSTSNNEDAFSLNIPDYVSTILNYFPASSGKTYSIALNNSTGKIPPEFSPFCNMKDIQALYVKELAIPSQDPITLPTIWTPSLQIHPPSSSSTTLSNLSRNQACILVPPSFSTYTPTPPQIYELGKSSIKTRMKHHEKQVESILSYLEELSFHYIEKIEERLVNGWVIIPRDFDEVKTKLKESRTLIRELQKKRIGWRDKISFIHFRIFDLEMTLEDIQDRHQLYVKNHMGHTS
uniref:Reverse transcriptase domain-containing protein n=1 Tax=Tanacetum cinerariifolium TaxID=118510 RepID=A0A6L2M9Z0_TANCI|nr:hypothetical protein [Tanacetum cinerariifolium]